MTRRPAGNLGISSAFQLLEKKEVFQKVTNLLVSAICNNTWKKNHALNACVFSRLLANCMRLEVKQIEKFETFFMSKL